MLVQDRDAQYYEPPLVQTEGPNAKKKETRTFDPPSSKLQKYQNICRYINQCDIQECWPTKENGNEGKKN